MRVYLTENLLTIDGGLGRRPMLRLVGQNDVTGDIDSTGNIFLHNYGLQRNLINTWQLVTVPLAAITGGVNVSTYNGLRIHLQEHVQPPTVIPPDCVILYDQINIQTGTGPQINLPTISVSNRSTIVGSTSSLNFVPKKGHVNRIVASPTDGEISLQLNNPGVDSQITAGGILTPASDGKTLIALTGQDVDVTIDTPTGSPTDGQKLLFRIKDDGSTRAITWSAIFVPIGVTLPTATTASKLLYIGCIYNADSGKWDVVAVTEQA